MPTYSLSELTKLADVTPRTVRFYVAQGLLPAPTLEGPNTRYTDEHLARLRAIRKLQAAHLPLAEIRRQLASMPVEQVTRVAEATATQPSAAIDYIRDILQPPTAPAAMPRMRDYEPPEMPEPPQSRMQPTETQGSRSQWERISLDPDIELHVRRPLTRTNNKRVERLIAIARELFEEE